MIETWFHVMNFIRVLINFIFIAQYKFHDDSTLNYFDQILFRLNAYKKIFRHSRFKEHEIEKNHFNFFKFHVITHYVNFIKRYKIANKYDTFHDETRHKYMIKNFILESINEKSFWRNWLNTTKNVLTFSRWKIWSDIWKRILDQKRSSSRILERVKIRWNWNL
jgi:hypothetical protein